MTKHTTTIFIKIELNGIFALDKWKFKKETKTWDKTFKTFENGNRFMLFLKISPNNISFLKKNTDTIFGIRDSEEKEFDKELKLIDGSLRIPCR